MQLPSYSALWHPDQCTWLTDISCTIVRRGQRPGVSLPAAQALKGEGELSEAILRNVYGMDSGRRKQSEAMARYVQRELACLAMTDTEAVMSGKVKFSTDFLDSN